MFGHVFFVVFLEYREIIRIWIGLHKGVELLINSRVEYLGLFLLYFDGVPSVVLCKHYFGVWSGAGRPF